MDQAQKRRYRHNRSHLRVRKKVAGTEIRPRLAVYKSLKYIYAQVIDDAQGVTIAQANSNDQEISVNLKGGKSSREAAKLVGETVAQRAKDCGVKTVVFDRGGYVYHGKVKDVADGARSKGLQF